VELQTLKRIAASTALALALTVSLSLTGPRAFADDHGDCRAKIERAQTKLDEAVRRHGDGSPEAAKQRRDLNAERERCWNKYHGYWSTQDQRWHTDRDWDDHDHDHDHDQH
jgi:hypothetical protein